MGELHGNWHLAGWLLRLLRRITLGVDLHTVRVLQ